jgi:hypothetical protein
MACVEAGLRALLNWIGLVVVVSDGYKLVYERI